MALTPAQVLKVCIPHTHRNSFDYLALETIPLIGTRVDVPFRNKQRLGIVIDVGAPEKETLNLKSINEILDTEPVITPAILQLCEWVSRYYQSPLSEVLPLALPKKLRAGLPLACPLTEYFQLVGSVEQTLTQVKKAAVKQQALIHLIANHQLPLAKSIIIKQGFSSAQLQKLQALNLIECVRLAASPERLFEEKQAPLQLNHEQQHATDTIKASLNTYQCFLLQGITGSGKTEVYLQVIAQVLNEGKQVLILVPEIGLTPQLVSRFNERFAHTIAVVHSNLNETERLTAWQLAKTIQASIIIGTRAAIFTPLPKLGLIIIDEEHDGSFKQMDGVRYSARDTALMRAHLANIPIILGSATPSLESLNNCLIKKYQCLTINQKALAVTPLSYQVIDLRNTTLNNGLTETTINQIGIHLKQNNQVLVFINRRGFAPILLCHQCGWMVECLHCDSHLTLHYHTKQLACHHCGLQQAIPKNCKQCQGKELIPVGAGTQRIANYLQELFPDTPLLRID